MLWVCSWLNSVFFFSGLEIERGSFWVFSFVLGTKRSATMRVSFSSFSFFVLSLSSVCFSLESFSWTGGEKMTPVAVGFLSNFPFFVSSSSSIYSPLELCWLIEMLESAWHRDSRSRGLEEILVGPISSPSDLMLAMVTLDMSSSSSS